MTASKHYILRGAVLLVLALLLAGCGGFIGKDNRHLVPLSAATTQKLAQMGSSPGEAMLIRIFKESSELEVWKRTRNGSFQLFKTYEVCAWSGELGPKIKEGDRQAPEGFYTITPGLMHPNSNYHLAFNTGFPNKFDRAWGRTGADLMVHGDCSSRGCFAMTDEQIKEIFALARESFEGGNTSFQLQIYPFRMTPANIARHASSAHIPFWTNLKEGYDRFELTRRPPVWDVCGKEYVFDVITADAAPLEAAAACPAFETDRTLTAQLAAKQAADAEAVALEVAALEQKAERDAAAAAQAALDAQKAEEERAVLAARGAAIGDFISGIGSAVGLGGEPEARKVINPNLVAPIPAPRLKRG